MKSKKVLVLGATGAMGKYLVPLLAVRGFQVDACALDAMEFHHPNVHMIVGNAMEWSLLAELLKHRYDGIVDFLIYSTQENALRLPLLASQTGHYLYLSTYRVYDNKEIPIRESSPLLIDTADDRLLRLSDDYSIYKARGEAILKLQENWNWTIVRPAITYSRMRYQLVTLEAPDTVGRAFAGKTAVLPEQARYKQATMSWAGDVAQMLARLLFNEKALGETYTVATSEHHTWSEIADYYRDICNLKTIWVDKTIFSDLICHKLFPNVPPFWQLECDRLFDRVIDNSKVLEATGLNQRDLKPLYDGLAMEIARCPKDYPFRVNHRMDQYLAGHGLV